MPSLGSNSSVLLPASSGSNGSIVASSSSHGDNNSIISTTTNSTTGNDSTSIKPISGQWTSSTNGHNNSSPSYLNNHHHHHLHHVDLSRADETRYNRNLGTTTSSSSTGSINSAVGGNINGPPNGYSSHSTSFSPSIYHKLQHHHDDPVTYNNACPSTSSTYFSRNGNSLEQSNSHQDQHKHQQQQQQLVCNNQKMEGHYVHLSINQNRRNPMSQQLQQQRVGYRPSLISLDSNDLTRPLFCYTLQLGVTMLGSGKGCVKPPDIVLHGSHVAPQHVFVERLANEAVLHPISEETCIDGRHIKGPTPLHSGALISIGDSYFFRFNDGSTTPHHPQPSPQPFYLQTGNSNSTDRLYLDESPYAVVNNRAKGNAGSSVGDVNKNLTIGEAFKSSSSFGYPTTTTSAAATTSSKTTPSTNTTSNKHQQQQQQSLPSLMEDFSLSAPSSCASTGTSTSSSSSSQPSTTSDSADHLLSETISTDSFPSSSPNNNPTKTQHHRDGLESENFVNKLARFEYLAHTQHSRPPPALPFPTVNSVLYEDGQCYSDNNSDSNSKNKCGKGHEHNYKNAAAGTSLYNSKLVSGSNSNMARPSVSFNRSDQGYNNHLFFTSHNLGETVSLNSNTTVVSTPESSSGGSCNSDTTNNGDRHTYRRAGGGAGGNVTFFDDYANLGANATPSPASMDYDEDSSLINQYSTSAIPSPDSLSSISNHRSYFSSTCNSATDMNSTANSAISRVACNGSPTLTSNTADSSSPTSNCSKSTMSSCGTGESGTMAGETLMELRRKQSRLSPPQKIESECLGLDEILAMCAEYEEQIAKELQEKKAMSTSTLLSSSSITDAGMIVDSEISPHGIIRSPTGTSTPTSPHYYSNGRIKTNGSLPRDPSRKAFNLTIPANSSSSQNNPHSHNTILSPKESPTALYAYTSHSRISDDVQSMTSSMTVSPCSLGSYSFTTDGKNSSSSSSSSNSPTSCVSFITSTPIPYASSTNNNGNSISNRAPTPGSSIIVSQSEKSPYENLSSSPQVNNGNAKLNYQEQQQQQRLRVPLSPSGIRTTPDYHRKPILLNSPDMPTHNSSNANFSSASSTTTTNTSSGFIGKPVLLSSSVNSSSVVGDYQQSANKSQQKHQQQQHQQKSKLSVSFSNSVQEYYDGKDDDDENDDDDCAGGDQHNNDSETSSDNGYEENGLDKICSGIGVAPINVASPYTTTPINYVSPSSSSSSSACRNQLRINGSDSTTSQQPGLTTTTRPSILRTISTQVQVHVQCSNKKGGGGSSSSSVGGNDDGDSSCFNGNGNSNSNNNHLDENSSRTLSNSNSNNDSHGQTNLMCSNNKKNNNIIIAGMNANEPPSNSNNSNSQTNGILKCRELNELVVATDVTKLGYGSTQTSNIMHNNNTNNSSSSSSISSSSYKTLGVNAEKCGSASAPTTAPSTSSSSSAPVILSSSSSLPSSTSVNQDLAQSSSSGSSGSSNSNNNNINSCTTTTQNTSRNAKISTTSLSSSQKPTTAVVVAASPEVVGSGPGNPTTTIPTSSSPLSSSSSTATAAAAASSTTFGKVHNGYLEPSKYVINEEEGRLAILKNEIMELEQQEMEALREMEIEKALLLGEEKSFESQTESDKVELLDLKERLAQIDESNRRWRALSVERIVEMKTKLLGSEKELQRLEKLHEDFCGSTDEETVLLERLKFQHELVEGDRKSFEDAEFHHMEEEVNKEAQREELTKTLADIGRKLLSRQFQLDQLRSHNRISINSSAKEIHSLEKRRQELIRQLRTLQQYLNSERGNESPTENGALVVISHDDTRNMDLEEKLKALHIVLETSGENAMHIERVKSRSPIDPTLGGIMMGPKTFETLREIERNREYLLNEQGAQMLEEERARVRELQKRVQDAVREEWEANRKSRNNQCHSLNSVGSEDSGQTISDTPTDSTGSGTDESNDTKSGAHSISTTDGSLSCSKRDDLNVNDENGSSGANGQLCQQMKQKTKEMAAAYEETRPLSDGSAYDDNSIVIMRDKHRIQSRPLTRYLPQLEAQFDLRGHVETSGHQLELCPDIKVTKTTAQGRLSKLGSKFHNWNKRFFIFDRETRTLTYYENEKKSKPRGCIQFMAIQDVYVDHLHSVKSPNPKLTFCVKTYNRVYHLLAPTPEAMRIWVDIIFTGAEGYQEFKCAS